MSEMRRIADDGGIEQPDGSYRRQRTHTHDRLPPQRNVAKVRTGREHLVESNWSSVSIDEGAICNLKVTQRSQSRYAMRPGTLSSLLPGTSGANGYLLSALANR